VSGLHCKPGMKPHRFFQPAPHAVALYGVAVFFGNGKTNAGLCLGQCTIERFNEEKVPPALFTCAYGKKLRPALQPPDSLIWLCIRHSPAIAIGHIRP
jgi:hypothetical protein